MILLAAAFDKEVPEWTPKSPRVETVLTGVGKANAARSLTEAILKHKPSLVINVGTSGTVRHKVGDILICRHFTDRDLQPLAIRGLTAEITVPAEGTPDLPSVIEGQDTAQNFSLSTGDSFVTETGGIEADAVDMEGFAEAQVCRHFGVPFVAVKYITDIIGQNSLTIWEEKLAQAKADLSRYFEHSGL